MKSALDSFWQHTPHIGQRIIKTSLAVLICLLISYLRGYSGAKMSAESMITAIICLQPYVSDTKSFAVSRLAGTLIGAVLGLLFLLFFAFFPSLVVIMPLLYTLMAVGVLLSLYTCVLLRKPDTASLAAIVFLCIVINFPDIERPLYQAYLRIIDTFIGTLVAVGINLFRLPRRKVPGQVFFLKASDLVADRFSSISSSILFQLNYLYEDGAQICITSEHAPAFFASQMSNTRLNTPMIVMDGAAIYDVNENRYLHVEFLSKMDAKHLIQSLQTRTKSLNIYNIHHNNTFVFHMGEITDAERQIYESLRRSPYRSYLEGENYHLDEIVAVKIVDSDKAILDLHANLHTALSKEKYRMVIRPQAGIPGVSGLYIYSAHATMARAQQHLLHLLAPEGNPLVSREIYSPSGYRSEREALRLLRQLGNLYEPISLFPAGKKGS